MESLVECDQIHLIKTLNSFSVSSVILTQSSVKSLVTFMVCITTCHSGTEQVPIALSKSAPRLLEPGRRMYEVLRVFIEVELAVK